MCGLNLPLEARLRLGRLHRGNGFLRRFVRAELWQVAAFEAAQVGFVSVEAKWGNRDVHGTVQFGGSCFDVSGRGRAWRVANTDGSSADATVTFSRLFSQCRFGMVRICSGPATAEVRMPLIAMRKHEASVCAAGRQPVSFIRLSPALPAGDEWPRPGESCSFLPDPSFLLEFPERNRAGIIAGLLTLLLFEPMIRGGD